MIGAGGRFRPEKPAERVCGVEGPVIGSVAFSRCKGPFRAHYFEQLDKLNTASVSFVGFRDRDAVAGEHLFNVGHGCVIFGHRTRVAERGRG